MSERAPAIARAWRSANARLDRISHRGAFFLLAALLAAFFSPCLFRGDVIFPHDNAPDIQAPPAGGPELLSSRHFSDQTRQYVPELNLHLSGNHRAWISTWNPHVQLGRPTTQCVGLSRAYPLTLGLSLLSSNPFRVYTWLAIATVALSAAFFFKFLESLGLHPLACLAGALGLGTSVFCSYWLTFVMFPATLCWSACILWLVTRWISKPSLGGWLGVAFACYALLLSGYPQQIVYQAYVVGPFCLIRLFRHGSTDPRRVFRSPGRRLVALALALVLGVACSSPVYLDLLDIARASGRVDAPEEFFLARRPAPEGLLGLARFLRDAWDPFWFGNPIRLGREGRFSGFGFTPFYAALLALTLAPRSLRRLWPWHLAIALSFLLALWNPAFRFAFRYLGFHFSRSSPLVAAMLPTFALCAYGADRVLRLGGPRPLAYGIGLLSWLAVAVMLGPVAPSTSGPVVAALFVAGAVTFAVTRSTCILLLIVAAYPIAYGQRMLLHRPVDTIRLSSPLLDELRHRTADGSRYAVVGDRPYFLLVPNAEALHGTRSVHSYDSLASQRFQRLASTLCPRGTTERGRYFTRIRDDSMLQDDALRTAGVGWIVSRQSINPRVAIPVADVGQLKLYRTLAPPLLEAQTLNVPPVGPREAVMAGELSKNSVLPVQRTEAFDDFLRLRTSSVDRPTLLFVSQQYHHRWRAHAEGVPLETVAVNGFYQGVLVPPGTEEVVLEFRPNVRWAWVPQAGFAFMTAALALRALLRARLGEPKRAGPP